MINCWKEDESDFMRLWHELEYAKYHLDRDMPLKRYRKAKIIPLNKTALAQKVRKIKRKILKILH